MAAAVVQLPRVQTDIHNILTSPALAGMRARNQWIVYVVADDPEKPGKLKKFPIHHQTAAHCSVVDPINWTDCSTAAAAAQAFGAQFGVGYCFTADDPYWFVDLDSCLQPDGAWSPLAQQVVTQLLPGAACEISAGGRGLHLFGRGTVPSHGKKNFEHHAEFYTADRFCAMTGTALQGNCDLDLTAGITYVAQTYFPPRAEAANAAHGSGPRPEWRGPTDDNELLRRAMQSRSTAAIFSGGTKASFADLWLADASVLRAAYPGDGENGYDASSADAALAQLLAFWTGADADRMIDLMKQSKLARGKWERPDYLPRTVAAACGMQREVLQDKAGPAAPHAATDAPISSMTDRGGATILNPEQYAELFKDCFYVVDHHKVLTPGGKLLKPDQFKALYGGYSFVMDRANTRMVRNAFEAFTESQALAAPKVDGTCFDPLQPYGTIIKSEGRSRVNTWWPPEVKRVKGDVSPFLDHLAKLLPDEGDRDKVLYYLANMVQHAGHKFQFAPLIIGTPGNGKTLLSRCVAAALGKRYVHWPPADKIGKQFNAWMFGKLAYLVEDAYVGGNVELLEKLKPMITGEALEIEKKGIDQEINEVCGNWLFNANRRDAIRKTVDDRRYMIVWCNQQAPADLQRDGMGEDYFRNLYSWAEKQDGYEIVAEYLHTVEIPPEYGLDWVKGRAPTTTSTAKAIEATRTPVEEEIRNAVEQGEIGFRGGWISSGFLHTLLAKLKRQDNVPRGQYSEILEPLGYAPHPALRQNNGQVNNEVLPDGKKPKLFCHVDHEAFKILRPADVAAAYARAQGVGT